MPTAAPPPPTDESAVLISQYPKEHRHVGRSFALSVFIHLFLAAVVCAIMYWLGIMSLRDLLMKGGAIAMNGPAPEQPMTVELIEEDLQPPPTPNPEFIQEIVKPKVVPPPPKKPVPKPPENRPKPKYTAPNAHGSGETNMLSEARVGSSGLPAPPYPYAARDARQEGTVRMRVVFGADGSVSTADVVQSSGFSLLDSSTRNFIFGHWKNAQLANHTIEVPVIYDLTHPSGH